jgi:hypothetical protein
MKLLDQVREVLRTKRYSYRTEQCYAAWIAHFIRFHRGADGWRHPADLDAADVERFSRTLPSGAVRKIDCAALVSLRNALRLFPIRVCVVAAQNALRIGWQHGATHAPGVAHHAAEPVGAEMGY